MSPHCRRARRARDGYPCDRQSRARTVATIAAAEDGAAAIADSGRTPSTNGPAISMSDLRCHDRHQQSTRYRRRTGLLTSPAGTLTANVTAMWTIWTGRSLDRPRPVTASRRLFTSADGPFDRYQRSGQLDRLRGGRRRTRDNGMLLAHSVRLVTIEATTMRLPQSRSRPP